MAKKRRNRFGLSNRLYNEAVKQARSAGVPLSTYLKRHGLDQLEKGIRTRYQNERAKRSAVPETSKGKSREIPTPMGGQSAWKLKRQHK